MRIGIDATCWANNRGYGRFTRELVGAMAPLAREHELVCFLDALSATRFSLTGSNVRPIVVHQGVAPTVAAASGGGRSPADMLRLSAAVYRERPDVFFSPSVYGYFPLPPRLPAVVTVHDAIAERFPELTLPTRRDRLFWRLKVGLALRQARLVLTPSQYAATQITTYLGVPPGKMRVTLEGVSDAFRPSDSPDEITAAAARVGLPAGARWLIYVGGFGPHKHVDLIVRAHAAVAQRHSESPLWLLLVGAHQDGFHSDVAGIRHAIEASGSAQRVIWTGFLPDEELRHLHSGALALLLPSASEGFGLPAVEAARCGAPVIAATESPLPDVLAGGGVFVEHGNLSALERAIEALATNEEERRAMGRRALERARRLSWTRSAQVALDALADAAKHLTPTRTQGLLSSD